MSGTAIAVAAASAAAGAAVSFGLSKAFGPTAEAPSFSFETTQFVPGSENPVFLSIRDLVEAQTHHFDSFENALIDQLRQGISFQSTEIDKVVTLLGLAAPFVTDAARLGIPAITGAAGALEAIVEAILSGKAIPPDALLSLVREAAVLAVRVGGPHVQQWLGPLTLLITQALPRIAQQRQRTNKFVDFDEPLDDPELRAQFLALPAPLQTVTSSLFEAIKWLIAQIGPEMLQEFWTGLRSALAAIGSAVEPVATPVGEFLLQGLDVVHGPMQIILERAAGAFFSEVLGKLGEIGEVTPDNVTGAAAPLVGLAGSIGMSAHLVAVLAEFISPFKHLGVPQIAALLADMAAFRPIVAATIGTHITTALRTPNLRAARRQFRPELPDPVSIVEMLYRRRLTDDEFRAYFAEQGWTDGFIEEHLASVFRKPTARDLAFAFEESEVDAAAILRLLQESGYNDEDAELVMRGVRDRANRKYRDALRSAVLGSWRDGLLTAAEAQDKLTPLGIRAENLALLETAIDLERTLKHRDQWRTVLIDQAAAGAVTVDDVRAQLAAWGYDSRAQDDAAMLAQLKRGLTTFREEHADLKAVMRKQQATQITAAEELYHRFLLDEANLAAQLQSAGVNSTWVDQLVELARVKRLPVPKAATVLSPDALVQEEIANRRKAILALQRNGVIDEAASAGLMQALGDDPTVAQENAAIIAARLTKPDRPGKPVVESPTVRATRAAEQADVLEQLRVGQVDAAGARTRLLQAGIGPARADALINRVLAQLGAAAEKEAAASSRRVTSLATKERERAAREAFHKGDLDEAGLRQTLLAFGYAPDLIDAIIERELVKMVKAGKRPPRAPVL